MVCYIREHHSKLVIQIGKDTQKDLKNMSLLADLLNTDVLAHDLLPSAISDSLWIRISIIGDENSNVVQREQSTSDPYVFIIWKELEEISTSSGTLSKRGLYEHYSIILSPDIDEYWGDRFNVGDWKATYRMLYRRINNDDYFSINLHFEFTQKYYFDEGFLKSRANQINQYLYKSLKLFIDSKILNI
jgi:hypothetical protein